MNTSLSMPNLLIAAATFAASSSSFAEILTVPSEDYPTLQGAIHSAENDDVVLVQPGTYDVSLTASGLDGCRNFTIRGNGRPEQTVIRTQVARHNFSGWVCLDRGVELMRFRFENLTFSGSVDVPGFKDGLYVSNCTADFVNCHFKNLVNDNNRDPRQPAGSDAHGAIKIHESDVSFTDCLFLNNGCTYNRGAIRSSATGGAMYIFNSDVEIDGCDFRNNFVRTTDGDRDSRANLTMARGGAICMKQGSLSVYDSSFTGNSARGIPGFAQPDLIQGGAIFTESVDSVWIKNSSFHANRAVRGINDKWSTGMGGAIYILSNDRGAAVRLLRNDFTENHADRTGGAVHAEGVGLVKANGDRYHCNTVNQVSGSWQDRGRNVFTDCEPACLLDVNSDGEVDKADMVEVLMNFGPAKDGSRYDLNGDGTVDYQDLVLVIANFNGCDK